MSFDAITGIAQAEDAANVAVQYAQAQAKQMIADAEAEGKAEIDAAVARAEKELHAGAEAKLDAAASLVAERVMKG